MTSDPAMGHAEAILNRLTSGDDDPRRTRIDFVQVAHFAAHASSEDRRVGSVLAGVRSLIAAQNITVEDLHAAARRGWPVMRTVKGPESYVFAAGRLIADGALRTPLFAERLQYACENPTVIEERLARWRETLEPACSLRSFATPARGPLSPASFAVG
jgi:hypothetical protein